MTGIGWLARYFLASVVAAWVLVKAVETLGEVGDLGRGMIFRRRGHGSKHSGPDA